MIIGMLLKKIVPIIYLVLTITIILLFEIELSEGIVGFLFFVFFALMGLGHLLIVVAGALAWFFHR